MDHSAALMSRRCGLGTTNVSIRSCATGLKARKVPRIPKGRSRPWVAKVKRKASEYGNADTSFYQQKPWRTLRLMILQNEPICRECERAVAQMVDHITPISQGGARLDPENLQPMCHSCHNRKRARERWDKNKE